MTQQAVHVYQPGNIPADAEDGQYGRYVAYGEKFTGVTFRDAFLHDAPDTDEQVKWIEQELYTRMQPGGIVRLLESPSLKSSNGTYR